MISLSSTPAMLDAMRTAKEITFSSYFLRSDSPVANELVAAARRGAHVTVRLNGYFFNGGDDRLAGNKQAVSALRALGADAKIVHWTETDGQALHLKAAVCDREAFLDDRNWCGRDIVIRETSRDDVLAIQKAAAYEGGHSDAIALTKEEALVDEKSTLLHSRAASVDVESETMTCKSPIYSALKRLAEKGVHCRVLLSSRYVSAGIAKMAKDLQRAHISVRFVNSSDKIAVSGKHGWVGSANATSPWYNPYQTDWGLRTHNPKIVRALRSRFNENWRAGHTLA